MIGIAKKAGRVTLGTDMICEALRANAKGRKIFSVFAASDVSDGTRKKLSDKCAFYETELVVTSLTAAELGASVGKSGAIAAIGITDEGLAAAVKKKIH